MRIVLISTPIGFLGSGKGGGVELTLNSLVSGLISRGLSVEVIAPKNSKLHAAPLSRNAKLEFFMVQHLMFVKIMKDKFMKQSQLVLV